jgi:seryl-tRNA synthetase
LDSRRRELLRQIESLSHQRKSAQNEVARRRQQGQPCEELLASLKAIAEQLRSMEDELQEVERQLNERLLLLPNLPHPSVPDGATEEANVEVRRWGIPQPKEFRKDHLEIASHLGLLGLPPRRKGQRKRLRVLHRKGGSIGAGAAQLHARFPHPAPWIPGVFPPFLVTPKAMQGTGQLPKLREDMYHIEHDDLYLIPTAEVPLTNYYADEVLPAEKLPIKLCGYSACFRREAGSYGRETRGLVRMHQFNKVELVKFCRPEESYEELEKLVAEVEELLQALGLVYRVVVLCAGDLGFASAKTYDLEVWSPASSGGWRFQAAPISRISNPGAPESDTAQLRRETALCPYAQWKRFGNASLDGCPVGAVPDS